ncbi:MAG: RNA polymerase sigma factor [Saprospiraceae bacterium]
MRHSDDINFEQVIRGCCKRDRGSQHQLYQLYYAYGMSICCRYMESESEAIFVLNAGFLKVFQNISKYNQALAFKPWFLTIVVNTAINHVKKQRKFKMEVSTEEAKNISENESIPSHIGYKELMAWYSPFPWLIAPCSTCM